MENLSNVTKMPILIASESLIGILESIGSHSVTSHELKQVIGLFAPMENGAQVSDIYLNRACI